EGVVRELVQRKVRRLHVGRQHRRSARPPVFLGVLTHVEASVRRRRSRFARGGRGKRACGAVAVRRGRGQIVRALGGGRFGVAGIVEGGEVGLRRGKDLEHGSA